MKHLKKIFSILLIFLIVIITSSCTYDEHIDDAIRNNDYEYVKEYFTKYPKRINMPLATKESDKCSTNYPLVEAILHGSSLEMVKLLIEELGASIDVCKEEKTLLMLSCIENNDDIIIYLLERDADIELLNTVSDASYDNNLKNVYFIVVAPDLVDYTFSLDVLEYLLVNDILKSEESRFATTLLEPILKDCMSEVNNATSPDQKLKVAEEYLDILKTIYLNATINVDFFTDQKVKEDWEVAMEIFEILKELK